MKSTDNLTQLTHFLRSALDLLAIPQNSTLTKEVVSICQYLENPTYRLAVFGPFNYGKSTLLNALLGQRTLPIDLIPTTGAAIYVRYGETLETRITLTDGTVIKHQGTDILKQYATLDEHRCMRDDVISVEVYFPHPFLKIGVEFLDLPGTNDREAQNDLVYEQLLTADLIIQVLDGRQLMTLGERENLRDWLLDRGITTVIFVVNFLNLLESEQQKQVYHRLRFVAESFRSNIPNGISNLYRVDALPALRARLKGDTTIAQTTGITTFESALQSLVSEHKNQNSFCRDRVFKIVQQIKHLAQSQREEIFKKLESEKQKNQVKTEIKKKALTLIKQGFERNISEFKYWLYLPNLIARYQPELINHLQQDPFESWQAEFTKTVLDYQNSIQGWLQKACDFFEHNTVLKLTFSFPDLPQIPKLEKQKTETTTLTAIPASLSWLLKKPAGAVVVGSASYILDKALGKLDTSESLISEQDKYIKIYTEIAEAYLTQFSQDAFSVLEWYEKEAEKVIEILSTDVVIKNSKDFYQLQSLNNLLDNLNKFYLTYNNSTSTSNADSRY